jgi:5-enolpyruvylshikimate-3-phosphate synthase
MIVTIKPHPLKGCIKAIPSKSFAHRALISAAISGRPTRVFCTETSDDIDSTVNCLSSLGANIRETKDGFEVIGSDFTGIRERERRVFKRQNYGALRGERLDSAFSPSRRVCPRDSRRIPHGGKAAAQAHERAY